MLPFYLDYIFASVCIILIVQHSIKKIFKPWSESKSNFADTTSHFNADGENMGTWNILKTLALTLLCSRKDATHHDTVYVKLNEHFKKISINNSKLKAKFLGSSFVLANSQKSMREFLCNPNCKNKISDNLRDKAYISENRGFQFEHANATYIELRKYTVKTLGKLGFGKNATMSVILEDTLNDVLENLKNLRNNDGNKILVQGCFSLPVVNIVWRMVGCEKFKIDDQKFQKLHHHVSLITHQNAIVFILGDMLPKFLFYILEALGINWTPMIEYYKSAGDIFKEYIGEIEERKNSNIDSKATENNFVSQFLSKIEEHKNDEQLNKIYSKEQLSAVLADIFAASVDTTSSFMECFVMYMVMYPEVQEKIQEEIDSVLGNSSASYLIHYKLMPYTQAVILEILRTATIVPFYIRTVSTESKIGNDILKKNTLIFMNQASMNQDEVYWGDAKTFRPERFLDENRCVLTDKANHLTPFGAGFRACPGENVAKAAIFILLVGILQRYTLVKSNKEEFIGLRKSCSITSNPEPFHFSLLLR